MDIEQRLADRVGLEQIIQQHCDTIAEITYIDHGHDNLVVCVNSKMVFRFPRNGQAARRLQFEIALLRAIKGKIPALPTPELIEVSTTPLYAITTYRDGMHLDSTQLAALTEAEQHAAGRKLAEFIVQFNNAISAQELMRLRKEAGLIGMDESWSEYFERLFERQPLPDKKLGPHVKHYYALWKTYTARETATFAIHDDLHPANIIFAGPVISAVLDFGDANVGSIEEEMRGLFRMGEGVLRAGIDRYHELTGRTILYDHVRTWVIMNELASFTRYLSENRTNHPVFLRSQGNLRQWLPDFPL